MLIEKNTLTSLVEKFIDNGCTSNPMELMKFKSYFKKDENNCFTVIDKDYSIKCLFDKNFVKEYLSTQPSYVKLDSFDGFMVMVKKAHFDVCFYKNVNKTISVRVILFILDFEVDSAQKIQKDLGAMVRKNVNFHPKISAKMNEFFYQHIKEKIGGVYNDWHPHCKISANNFIHNAFPYLGKKSSIEKVLPPGSNYILLNTSSDLYSIDDRLFLQEVPFKDEDKDIPEIEDDNINIENLQKIDFRSFFYKQPSQVGKSGEDGGVVGQVEKEKINTLDNENEITVKIGAGGCRSESDLKLIEKYIAEMPEVIKNLVKKYENKKITLDTFEKFRVYKKYNASEYTRDKL